MKKILIKGDNISKFYGEGDGKTFALNDVSFEIYEGEFLVIYGASGSGKSTLLNIIAGVDSPDEGTLVCNEQLIKKYNDRELTEYRSQCVGYIFQYFNLLDDLSVYSNIILAPGAEKDENKINELLNIVGLLDKKDRYPRQLSGGEQQRVSIARALNKRSLFLLCDEPTGSLDYESGKTILSLLEKINIEQGKTIVLVTHNKEISAMADRIITMKNGKIISEIINDEKKSSEDIDW